MAFNVSKVLDSPPCIMDSSGSSTGDSCVSSRDSAFVRSSNILAISCISGAQNGFSNTGNNSADFSESFRSDCVNAIRKSVMIGVALVESYRIISG